MPIYAMFIEDEDMMEERMITVFPGYVGDTPNSLYTDVSDSLIELKKILNEKVEDDMKIRSNFEFSVENKNFIKDPNFKKKIQKGISILRNQGLLNDEIESKIRDILNIIP